MKDDDPEPIEKLEEIIFHPADKTFDAFHDKGLIAKKELNDERRELGILLQKLPECPPAPGSKTYAEYQQIQNQIEGLKNRVSKKHDDLMEILKYEEKISREIKGKK